MVIIWANLFSCELGRYWCRHVETIYSGFWFRESKATDVNVADGLPDLVDRALLDLRDVQGPDGLHPPAAQVRRDIAPGLDLRPRE